MIMEIQKGNFVEFLKMCKLNGTLPDGKKANLMNRFVINATKDGINVNSVDSALTTFIEVSMKATVKDEGRLPIGDVDEFMKYVNRMGGNLTISFDERIIKLEDGVKTAEFPAVADDEFQQQQIPYEKESEFFQTMSGVKLDTSFEISSMFLRELIDDSNLIGIRQFPIDVKEDKVGLRVGEPQSSMITTTAPIIDKRGEDVSCIYSRGFGNVFSNLTGHVKIYLTTDAPLIVENIDTSKITFRAMLAPYGVE